MTSNNKVEYVKLGLAVIITIFGCALLIAGFCVPPLGVIDNSVLIAFGEILTFAGTVLGINYSYQLKVKKLEDKINKE